MRTRCQYQWRIYEYTRTLSLALTHPLWCYVCVWVWVCVCLWCVHFGSLNKNLISIQLNAQNNSNNNNSTGEEERGRKGDNKSWEGVGRRGGKIKRALSRWLCKSIELRDKNKFRWYIVLWYYFLIISFHQANWRCRFLYNHIDSCCPDDLNTL